MKTIKDYFGDDELAASVFLQKYALRDQFDNVLEESPEQMFRRIAKEFARICKPMIVKHLFGRDDHENFKFDF